MAPLAHAYSICINQRNLREKGHQVAMMGQIYKAAIRVLICVGSTGSESAPGLRNLAASVNQMIDEALYHTINSERNDSVTESWPEHDHDKIIQAACAPNNGPRNFDYQSAVERCLDVPRWNLFPFLPGQNISLKGPEWV